MTGVVLAATVSVAGLLLTLGAVRRRGPSRAAALARLDRARRRQQLDEQLVARRAARAGAELAEALARRGVALERLRADLAATDQPLAPFAGRLLVSAATRALLPTAALVVLDLSGLVDLPPVLVAGVAVAGGLLGALLPVTRLRSEATRCRRDLGHATGVLLHLVALQLSAGRDLATALAAASSSSDAPAMRLLASALSGAAARDLTPWAALRSVGEKVGVDELVAAAGALALVPGDRVRLREAVAAQAALLRRRELVELGGEPSRERAQTTLAAQVLLAAGTLLFLLYPAVAAVLVTETL